MEEKQTFKISVRNLVDFAYCSGDLGSGFTSMSRAMEGTKAHHMIQKSAGEEYLPEVPVSMAFERNGVLVEVEGRIDGIIQSPDGIILDEIKSTTAELDDIDENYSLLHWAQAKCYAYMYGTQNQAAAVEIRLIYVNIDTSGIKMLPRSFNMNELEAFFLEILDKYAAWVGMLQEWYVTRDISIRQLEFPFKTYRLGQRELAVAVYKSVRNNARLFVQAPTGIGKTIATLFPAIKSMLEENTKIFYLTAKTITRTVAENAVDRMRELGLRIKSITITAKDKTCFNKDSDCDPDTCRYMQGYFDKLHGAIRDIYHLDAFTRPVIEEHAARYGMCPFEFSLDLSNYCDCVICDYNYVFDPTVNLKRFFSQGVGNYVFLIDEAHNLVDRAREMFSAEVTKKPFLELKNAIKKELPSLVKKLNEINKHMVAARKRCEEEENGFWTDPAKPKELYTLLKSFAALADAWLSRNHSAPWRPALLELYFQALDFLRTFESYDERFITYCEKSGSDVRVKLLCLDPSKQLDKAMRKGKAAVLFSATLTPLDYFIQILGGNEDSGRMRLRSPFPRENLCLLVDDTTSTRYKMRELTYDKVARMVLQAVRGKTGNYLVFFPSYKYMSEVLVRFSYINDGARVIYQKGEMAEQEREEFLQQFSSHGEQTLVGFAVLGGIFGEGIDLTGDRLSGAIVVGVGLPQIGLERNIIRKHFDENKGKGFEYAYMYPGMNKVLQAVGRVIRTETDRGMVLLIDERFSYSSYEDLFPEEWHPVTTVRDEKDVKRYLKEFWG
jgi:DNA excision repair protein ERCC-2